MAKSRQSPNFKSMKGEDTYYRKLVEFLEKRKYKVRDIEALTPDASTRRYFRITMESKDENSRSKSDAETKIAMVMGDIDRKIVFEEILEKQVEFRELPFINISRFLRKIGVNVPEIYDEGDGVIILEDFGDTPLDVFVNKSGFEKATPYYEDAVSQLVVMQNSEKDDGCYAFSLEFTYGMLMWEFNHFSEYFMGFPLDKDPEMKKEFEEISKVLSSTPYKFTHRDFHSKNLMCLPEGKVGIIDFQDALMAPYVYDLVSLTCDAYVDIPEDLEKHLISLYIKKSGEKGFEVPEDFETHYLMCAVQRTFKAGGRFLYIHKEKGNPKFLRYVVPAVKKGLRCAEKIGLKSSDKIKEMLEEIKV